MLFNSRDEKFKYPFGAVEVGQKVRFTFPCQDSRFVLAVDLIVRYKDESTAYPLLYKGKEGNFSLFEGEITLFEAGIYYYRFEVKTYEGVEYYGKSKNSSFCVRGDFLPEFQLTVYKQNYSTPEWVKGGVIYHIFADRFNRKDYIKKGVFHDNWYELPNTESADGKFHADDFFGGNLKGIEDKLDYLESLGVTLIYLSPIFESFSNHRYDTGNFLKLDERVGTDEDFARLCAQAKKRGIRVMLDGVFNHSGSDSLYFNKHNTYDTVGAYNDINSPYHDWYYFDSFPDGYASWWGIRNVPTLNKDNPEYRNLIFGEGGVIEKWTSLGASGWRLDVADELPSEFIEKLRAKLKRVNSDALLIGEVWEDASTKCSYGTYRPYLLGSELDGVMNYPFMRATLDFAKGGDKQEFVERVSQIIENYPKQSLDATMNFIGTHDTVRALNALSFKSAPSSRKEQKSDRLTDSEREMAKRRLKLASVIEFTLPGVPSIFYGDEAGVEGWSDPLNRVTFPWGREDAQLVEHFKKLGKIRKDNKQVFSGKIKFVESDCLEYIRYSDEDSIRIIVNNTDEIQKISATGKDLISGKVIKEKIEPYSFCIVQD